MGRPDGRGCTCEAEAREHYQRHVTPDEVAWWCGMFGCSACTTAHAYCDNPEGVR